MVKKSQIGQHVGSKTHKKNHQLKRKRNVTQAQLEDYFAKKPKKSRVAFVGKELCEAFLTASFSWMKLDVPKFRGFLESNIGISMPDRTTLEKKYLGKCYQDVIREIQDSLGDKPMWVGVDETTDAMARYVANVLIRRLDNEKDHAPYLANVVFLEKTNSATISRLVNNTLKFLWPNFDADLLKLLLSDAAAYMLKSGWELKVFYPTLLHITCLAYGLHCVCESICEIFPEVNDLICTVKRIL